MSICLCVCVHIQCLLEGSTNVYIRFYCKEFECTRNLFSLIEHYFQYTENIFQMSRVEVQK